MQEMQMVTTVFLIITIIYAFGSETEPERKEFNEPKSCWTSNYEAGRCVSLRDCPYLLKLSMEVKNELETEEHLWQSHCDSEGTESKVCCPLKNDNSNKTGAESEKEPGKLPHNCGKSGAPIDRVVEGKPASLRAWPWVAALGYLRSFESEIKWECAGSLITDRHVITAGHCIAREAKLVTVRLGDLDLSTTDDEAKHIDIPVDRTIVHPDFDHRKGVGISSDIGIVRLRDRVHFNEDIRPICLPFSKCFKTDSYVGYKPFIVGWGEVAYRQKHSTTRLIESQVEIKSLDDCNSAFSRLNRQRHIDERVVCAGGEGTNVCAGDCGGPLMIPKEGLFYLYGIVSFRYKCGEPGIPSVFTRVTEFMTWIAENVD